MRVEVEAVGVGTDAAVVAGGGASAVWLAGGAGVTGSGVGALEVEDVVACCERR